MCQGFGFPASSKTRTASGRHRSPVSASTEPAPRVQPACCRTPPGTPRRAANAAAATTLRDTNRRSRHRECSRQGRKTLVADCRAGIGTRSSWCVIRSSGTDQDEAPDIGRTARHAFVRGSESNETPTRCRSDQQLPGCWCRPELGRQPLVLPETRPRLRLDRNCKSTAAELKLNGFRRLKLDCRECVSNLPDLNGRVTFGDGPESVHQVAVGDVKSRRDLRICRRANHLAACVSLVIASVGDAVAVDPIEHGPDDGIRTEFRNRPLDGRSRR